MTGQELINRLRELGEDRLVIINEDGNTYGITTEDVNLWDDSEDSPVEIRI